MTKHEFLSALQKRLSGLPREDVVQSLDFYSEMIDDRIEDGLDEAAAVAGVGELDEIVATILQEVPLPKLLKEKVAPRRALRAWEIVLLILGSPVWLPLLAAVLVLVLTAYCLLWTGAAVLYTIVLSFVACALYGVAELVICLTRGEVLVGLFLLGAGLACAGLAILTLLGSNRIVKGIVMLGKCIVLKTKLAVVKEAAK